MHILAAIILHATPSLKCVKRKLHRHYCIVNIVPVVDLAEDLYVCDLLKVILLKLKGYLLAMFGLCLCTDCPMLGCVEGVEAWNLSDYDLVGQLSGIR